jgi:predicted CoA-binding protein
MNQLNEKHSLKTLILGASVKPGRYALLAANSLTRHGHEIELVGRDRGEINGVKIKHNTLGITNIDTVSLYLNPSNQEPYENFILELKPRRVIFNPGTENPDFESRLTENGIEAIEACTLVMLSTNQY